MKQTNIFLSLLLTVSMLSGVARAAGKYSGGAGDGFGAASSEVTGLGATPVTLSFPSDQIIERSWTNVPCGMVTISDGAPAAITAAGNLRLSIPDSLFQTWDTTITAPTFGGSAAGSVAETVSYAQDGKTLVVTVTSNFANNDTLTINGLVFTNLTQACLPERLRLDIHNDDVVDAWSDNVFGVTVLRPGGLGDGGASFTMAQDVRLVVPGETILILR